MEAKNGTLNWGSERIKEEVAVAQKIPLAANKPNSGGLQVWERTSDSQNEIILLGT